MKEKQWVQHISGQGEKWPVSIDLDDQWKVENDKPNAPSFYHCLPKSEYRPCDPPEVWKDVTERVKESSYTPQCWYDNPDEAYVIETVRKGYRLRKVTLYAMARPIIDPMQREVAAFIVEQKVTE